MWTACHKKGICLLIIETKTELFSCKKLYIASSGCQVFVKNEIGAESLRGEPSKISQTVKDGLKIRRIR